MAVADTISMNMLFVSLFGGEIIINRNPKRERSRAFVGFVVLFLLL